MQEFADSCVGEFILVKHDLGHVMGTLKKSSDDTYFIGNEFARIEFKAKDICGVEGKNVDNRGIPYIFVRDKD